MFQCNQLLSHTVFHSVILNCSFVEICKFYLIRFSTKWMNIGFCYWKAIPFDIFQLIVSELIKVWDILCLLQIYTDLVPLTWKLIFKFILQRKSYVCNIFNGKTVTICFITTVLQIFFPFGSDRMLFISVVLSKSIRKAFSHSSTKYDWNFFLCFLCFCM